MFAKLKSSNSPTPPEKTLPATPIDINPISEYFDVRKQVGSAGPELAWKIYDAVRRSDDTVSSCSSFHLFAPESLLILCGSKGEILPESQCTCTPDAPTACNFSS